MRSQEYSTSISAAEIDEFGDSARAAEAIAIANAMRFAIVEGRRVYLANRHPELADQIGAWPAATVEAMFAQDINVGIQNPDSMV